MAINRKVLVDNSTLSGVERIVGNSQTINLSYKDNDILCLEKLITAILFSDQIIAVDDYKDKFRSKRLKNFSFVDFIKIKEENYSSLTKKSASFAKSMTFSFDGDKPAGDVVSFFESLKIDPQLRWDIFASSEYLTLSFLVNDLEDTIYESSMDSIFRNECTDSTMVDTGADYHPMLNIEGHSNIDDLKSFIEKLSSQNPQYKGQDWKSSLGRIMFGYGWAAERAHFYNSVAAMENADTYLAPLRDAFCESCCRIDYPSNVSGLLEGLKRKSQSTLEAIITPSGQSHFAIKLPFFTAYLISKTDSPIQCIEQALIMRTSKDFQNCREIFHNLDHLSTLDKRKEINGILKYLDKSCQNLMKKYAVSTDNGLQFSLSLGLTGISVGTGLKLDNLFRDHKNRPFTRVFRNIAQEMLNVERLGGLYEKLMSTLQVNHKKATHPAIRITPKYMEHRESEFGRPAKLK